MDLNGAHDGLGIEQKRFESWTNYPLICWPNHSNVVCNLLTHPYERQLNLKSWLICAKSLHLWELSHEYSNLVDHEDEHLGKVFWYNQTFNFAQLYVAAYDRSRITNYSFELATQAKIKNIYLWLFDSIWSCATTYYEEKILDIIYLFSLLCININWSATSCHQPTCLITGNISDAWDQLLIAITGFVSMPDHSQSFCVCAFCNVSFQW